MAVAVNKLAEVGGGQVVVKNGRVIGLVELGIGGLMSAERAQVVARKAATVLAGFEACGCKLNNPNMQLSLLALVVIPELRISDKGLVDVTKFDFVPVLQGLPAAPELALPRRKSSNSLRGRENEAPKKE
jgi:adenine deaminase